MWVLKSRYIISQQLFVYNIETYYILQTTGPDKSVIIVGEFIIKYEVCQNWQLIWNSLIKHVISHCVKKKSHRISKSYFNECCNTLYVCKLERNFQINPTPLTLPPSLPPPQNEFLIFLKSNLICKGNKKKEQNGCAFHESPKALDVSCKWAWHRGFCFFNSLGAPVFRSLTLLSI